MHKQRLKFSGSFSSMKLPELHNDVLKFYNFLPNTRRYASMRELYRKKEN